MFRLLVVILFYCTMKSVTHHIRGFIERLLKAIQRVLGSHKQPLEQWFRTTDRDQWWVSTIALYP